MRTTTRTATWARTELLLVVVRLAVRRLANDPERLLRRVLEPGLEKQVLRRLTFLGLDADDRCHARLSLAVDWDEHRRLNVVQGRLTVPGRIETAVPEVCEMLGSFERVVEDRNLRVGVGVSLCRGVDVREARTLLGLAAPRAYAWAGAPASAALAVKRLPELEVQLDLADTEE